MCQISSKSEGWLANHWLIWHGMTRMLTSDVLGRVYHLHVWQGARDKNILLLVPPIGVRVHHQELRLVRVEFNLLHHLFVFIFVDREFVDLDDSIALTKSGGLGRWPGVNRPDVLTGLALLRMKVETVAVEVRRDVQATEADVQWAVGGLMYGWKRNKYTL